MQNLCILSRVPDTITCTWWRASHRTYPSTASSDVNLVLDMCNLLPGSEHVHMPDPDQLRPQKGESEDNTLSHFTDRGCTEKKDMVTTTPPLGGRKYYWQRIAVQASIERRKCSELPVQTHASLSARFRSPISSEVRYSALHRLKENSRGRVPQKS